MSFFGAARTPTVTQPPEVKDIEVANPPEDSISRIAFCPTADYLAVASWDGEVGFWKAGLRLANSVYALFRSDYTNIALKGRRVVRRHISMRGRY
jgi:mRNA export factor